MCVIGITGGIGSGKSAVARILKEKYGAAVIDTDAIGHELMEAGKPAYKEVIRNFGGKVTAPDGSIDRKVLGSIVFADRAKLEVLNSIIHPAVGAEVDKKISEYREKYKYIALETALLLKVGYNTKCDKIWFIYADKKTRLERLVNGRGMDRKKAVEIFNTQNTDEEFIAAADEIIDNSSSEFELENRIQNILERYGGGNNAGVT